jgi:hypothetical protein
MEKIRYIIREIFYLIRRQKAYFFAPILLMLALLAFLVYTIAPRPS